MTVRLSERIKQHLTKEYGLAPEDVDLVYAASVESLKQNIQDLETFLQASHESAAQTAHGMKGNLLNMGLPELAQRAKEIEEDAKKGNLTCLEPKFLEIKEQLAEVL